jgi:hypothetical protein
VYVVLATIMIENNGAIFEPSTNAGIKKGRIAAKIITRLRKITQPMIITTA